MIIKTICGIARKIGPAHFSKYDATKWWDRFYSAGVSDQQTISQTTSAAAAQYHYASTDLLILRHMINHGISMNGARVLDIGSGAGRWITFCKRLGAFHVSGVDVSSAAAAHLMNKYAGDASVEIFRGKAHHIAGTLRGKYDVVIAVGVMFHIVDDAEWKATIKAACSLLSCGGLFIVGGHFGIVGNLDVQVDEFGDVNKRLRSRRQWESELKKEGLNAVKVYRNYGGLMARCRAPENNVMIATKGTLKAKGLWK